MQTLPCVLLTTMMALIGPCSSQDKVATVPVFGVVQDAAGIPVAGATVREVRLELDSAYAAISHQLGLGTRYGATTATDDRGRFVLKATAGGMFGIVAMRGTDERSQVVAPAAPAGHHQLTLHPLVRIQGRIVDIEHQNGNESERPPVARIVRSFGPVQSAIRACPEPAEALGVIEQVTTDEQGCFELAILAGAACSVADQFSTCSVEVPQGSRDEVLLKRKVRRVTSILANAQTGQIVPAARLHVDGAMLPIGAQGEFEAYLPEGGSAAISAPGFAPCMIRASYNVTQIEMQPARNVSFEVIGPDGQAAAGIHLVSTECAFAISQETTLVRRHTTDAFGKFVMPRNSRSNCTIWAVRDHRLIPVKTVMPSARASDVTRAETQPAEIQIATKTYAVRGTVVGNNDMPVAHVPVYAVAYQADATAVWSTLLAFTDHAGKFVAPALPAGDYRLYAQGLGDRLHGPKLRSAEVKVEPAAGMAVRLKLIGPR